MRRTFLVTAAMLAAVAVAAAPLGAARTATTLKVVTRSGLTYNVKALKTKAGKIVIRYTNDSGIPHNVRVKKGTRQLGGTKTITKGITVGSLTLKKGKYTFYCSVPGHEQAGMKGSLTVS